MEKLEQIADEEVQRVIDDLLRVGSKVLTKFKANDGTWTLLVAAPDAISGKPGLADPTRPAPVPVPPEPPAPGLNNPGPITPGKPGVFVSARRIAPQTILYVDDQGHDLIRQGGSRSWRNFNPGNIRAGSFAQSQGSIGDDGAFAIFPDERAGTEAIVSLLQTVSYVNLTLQQAIFRYAPPSENDSQKYLDFVVNKTGIQPGTVLSTLGKSALRQIASTFKVFEGWSPGTERPNLPTSGGNPKGGIAKAGSGVSSSAGAADADWMEVARREAALPENERSEWPTGANPRIMTYFRVAAPWFEPVGGDEVDWCAAFVNYCLVTSGHVGTDHPGARSFYWNRKRQFVALETPVVGSIAVRRYPPFSDPSWVSGPGHVGFVVSFTSTSVTLLGGNQSNTVKTSTFPLVQKAANGSITAKFVTFQMPVIS